jgi:putative transposase
MRQHFASCFQKNGRAAAQREAVAHLQAALGLSERRACSIVSADRKMIRYFMGIWSGW